MLLLMTMKCSWKSLRKWVQIFKSETKHSFRMTDIQLFASMWVSVNILSLWPFLFMSKFDPFDMVSENYKNILIKEMGAVL